jgi:hypothetical protein
LGAIKAAETRGMKIKIRSRAEQELEKALEKLGKKKVVNKKGKK